MKKIKNLSALLLVIVIVSLFVACGNEIVDEATDKLENKIEYKTEIIEEKIENAVEKRIADNNTTYSNETEKTNNIVDISEEIITAEQAEEIVLDYAKLSSSDVIMERTEYDIDDGIPNYEVEFRNGSKEYNYEIHAVTGEILHVEIEIKAF